MVKKTLYSTPSTTTTTTTINFINSLNDNKRPLYRTLCLQICGGGNIYLNRDMEKPGSSAYFPKSTGCTSWFFRMSARTK